MIYTKFTDFLSSFGESDLIKEQENIAKLAEWISNSKEFLNCLDSWDSKKSMNYLETLKTLKNSRDQTNIVEFLTILESLPVKKRDDIMTKILYFIKADSKDLKKDQDDNLLPKISKFDVVLCNFTGVGYEWNGPHYGVVWDTSPILDSFTIIPTTSQPRQARKNVINIGKVKGLNGKDTVLLISDIAKVSRKRIEIIEYNHPKTNKKQKIRIVKAWEETINESIATTLCGIKTFEECLLYDSKYYICSMKELENYRYKAVFDWVLDEDNKVIKFRRWKNTQEITIPLLAPTKSISKSQKLDIIKNSKYNKLELFNEYYGIRN